MIKKVLKTKIKIYKALHGDDHRVSQRKVVVPDGNGVHQVNGEGKAGKGLEEIGREKAADGTGPAAGALVAQPEHARRPDEADDAKDDRGRQRLVDRLGGGNEGHRDKGQQQH